MAGSYSPSHPGAGMVNAIGVASFDVALQDDVLQWVHGAGGNNVLSKTADTEGNTFGMMQADPSAN